MKRRSALRSLAAAMLGTFSSAWLPGCRGEDRNARASGPLAEALRTHFSYLEIDPSVITEFVRDHESKYGPWTPRSGSQPYGRFLASTDFFQNGADESRPLRYVAYYDPYVSPCYNPFTG